MMHLSATPAWFLVLANSAPDSKSALEEPLKLTGLGRLDCKCQACRRSEYLGRETALLAAGHLQTGCQEGNTTVLETCPWKVANAMSEKQESNLVSGLLQSANLGCWPPIGEWHSVQACLPSGSMQSTGQMLQPPARQSTLTCTMPVPPQLLSAS